VVLVAVALIGPMIGGTLFGPPAHRYAAGEVSQEEYENMRRNLRAIPAFR
jgi:hypothetical protein